MPFWHGDQHGQVFSQYQHAGVGVVIILQPRAEYLEKADRDLAEFYMQNGLHVVEMPIYDFSTPDPHRLFEVLQETLQFANQGVNVAVHCHAGYGRTGTFLACLYMVINQVNGLQAVNWVRTYVPPAVETIDQVKFIEEFGANYAHNKR